MLENEIKMRTSFFFIIINFCSWQVLKPLHLKIQVAEGEKILQGKKILVKEEDSMLHCQGGYQQTLWSFCFTEAVSGGCMPFKLYFCSCILDR